MGGLRAWRQDVRAALPAWVVARALALVAYLGGVWLDRVRSGPRPFQLGQDLFAWDAGWYVSIASAGYGALDAEALRFFPLWPLLGAALGGERLPMAVLANLLALAAGAAVHRLAREATGDASAARAAAWAVALLPPSFVLVLAYAEPLWLLASALALLGLLQGRWVAASVWGALAALARPLGVVLVVAAVVEALRRRSFAPLTAAVGPALATAGYLGWVAWRFPEDRWAPLEVQDQFRGGFVDPVSRVAGVVGDLLDGEVDGLHLPFVVAALALVALAWWRLPGTLAAVGTATVLLALAAENLNSFERYVLNAAPLVVAAGVWLAPLAPSWRRLVGLASAAGFVALLSLAWNGSYVP